MVPTLAASAKRDPLDSSSSPSLFCCRSCRPRRFACCLICCIVCAPLARPIDQDAGEQRAGELSAERAQIRENGGLADD
jgi:hypothetical protein